MKILIIHHKSVEYQPTMWRILGSIKKNKFLHYFCMTKKFSFSMFILAIHFNRLKNLFHFSWLQKWFHIYLVNSAGAGIKRESVIFFRGAGHHQWVNIINLRTMDEVKHFVFMSLCVYVCMYVEEHIKWWIVVNSEGKNWSWEM